MPASTVRLRPCRMTERLIAGLLVAGATLLGIGAPSTQAAVDPVSLAALPIVDDFGVSENPLSGGGAWTQMASAVHPGYVSGGSIGWSPYNAYPALHGAFWQVASLAAGGNGAAVAATLTSSPSNVDRHFSLWMDIPDGPSSGSAGYELRFTQTAFANTYDLAIVRWEAGAGTVLATQTGYVLPPGGSFALADAGATVSAWVDVGGGFTQVLSADDSTFDSGFVGIAGAGNITRIRSFRAGALTGAPAGGGGGVTLKANYRLHGNRRPDLPTSPPLTDIGGGNTFAVETLNGKPRLVLTFPRGGGLSLPTAGLIDSASHSVAMTLRLADRTGYRRLLDFSNGTSDNGLYNLGGRAVLYSGFGSPGTVFGPSYAHLVFTSANAGGGFYDTAVYVNGARVVAGRMSTGFGLGSGILRFFKDNTTGGGPGEESAGAVACIQIYDGTLTSSQIGEIAARQSRCEPPTGVPRAPSAGSERVQVSKRRRPRAKRWNGATVVDTGLTVSCSRALAPCVARGRVEIAPAFKWMKAGAVTFTVPAMARRKVVVRLSRRGSKALRRAGRLEVRVLASIRGPAGTSASKRQTGAIKSPRRHRR